MAVLVLTVWMLTPIGAQATSGTLRVIPSGQTIGIRIATDGVIVVATEHTELRYGDRIVRIGDDAIHHIADVARSVHQWQPHNRSLAVTVVRNGTRRIVSVVPKMDAQMGRYRLGVRLREGIAGIGTLTYVAPQAGVFGALGHKVTQPDTQAPIVMQTGTIVRSMVTSIAKSHDGVPGEKRAVLIDDGHILGTVKGNTEFGIYGTMDNTAPIAGTPIEIARIGDVREGAAHMYTVVDGQTIERFDVRIVHVEHQTSPAQKGFVVHIEDARLLARTGGIVQGMSGSPIVQNNKLIGALTHVFVNNPKNGYGCYAQWMAQQSGLFPIGSSAVP
jgi:stage IV sporulation protein B